MDRYSVSSTKTSDGTFTAYLACNNEQIASAVGLKNPRAVKKWAHGTAADHKNENLPTAVETETHSYVRTFSI